jgi:cytochrome c553
MRNLVTTIRYLTLLAAVAVAATAPARGQNAPAATSAAIAQKAATCVPCHGPNGNSENPAFPVLAGQSWRYIYIQLKDFKEARRSDPAMSPMVADLSRDDMIALGNYFAAQKPLPVKFTADAARIDAGRKTSDAVLCPMCHLGGFVGQNEIPRVAGQWPQYIKKQLSDFRARRRTNDAGNMTSVAGTLSDDDIENLAQYIANLN